MGVCQKSDKRVTEGNVKGALEQELLENTKFSIMENYICKVYGNDCIGTGFFCRIKYNKKKIPVLMTNYHVIDDKFLKEKEYLKVVIKDSPHMININKDSILYFSADDKYDVMIIKINKDDENIKNYLQIDSNIFQTDSLSKYENEDLYIIHYPKCEKAHISFGKGIKQIGEYDIKHECNTDAGSSGAPILSSSTNKVIGIHKGCEKNKIDESKTYNIGTFLKFPLELINNYIVAEIYMTEEWINEDIRIINSYEHATKICIIGRNLNKEECENENEINKCQITINDEPIPFSYFHKFKSEGKYIIKYSFKDYLTKTNEMFRDCRLIKNIDLSNFKTRNVTNMMDMFSGCLSLENVNFSNIDSQKVINMNYMFNHCPSLKKINLSNINTKNVVSMDNMFQACNSLIKENVITTDERVLRQFEKDLNYMNYTLF